MNSWLLKLLSRGMKTQTKNKDQPTSNHKKQTKKQKNKSDKKYTTYHGPPSQRWIDGKSHVKA